MAYDLSQLSDSDLMSLTKKDYASISDAGIKILSSQKAPTTKPVPTAGSWQEKAQSFNEQHPYLANTVGAIPAAVAGAGGELIKDVGALGELVTPTGSAPNQWINQNITQPGENLTNVGKALSPVAGTVGQIGSYIVPYTGALKGVRAGAGLAGLTRGAAPLTTLGRAAEAIPAGAITAGATTPDAEGRGTAAAIGGLAGGAAELAVPYLTGVGKGIFQGAREGLGGAAAPEATVAAKTLTPEIQAQLPKWITPETQVPTGGAGEALGQNLGQYLTSIRPVVGAAGTAAAGMGVPFAHMAAGAISEAMGAGSQPLYKTAIQGVRDLSMVPYLEAAGAMKQSPGITGITDYISSKIMNPKPDANPISAVNSGFTQELKTGMATTPTEPLYKSVNQIHKQSENMFPGMSLEGHQATAIQTRAQEILKQAKDNGLVLPKEVAETQATTETRTYFADVRAKQAEDRKAAQQQIDLMNKANQPPPAPVAPPAPVVPTPAPMPATPTEAELAKQARNDAILEQIRARKEMPAPMPVPGPIAPIPIANQPMPTVNKPLPTEAQSKLDAIRARLKETPIETSDYTPNLNRVAAAQKNSQISKDVNDYFNMPSVSKGVDKGMLGDLETKYKMKLDYSKAPNVNTMTLKDAREAIKKWITSEIKAKGTIS